MHDADAVRAGLEQVKTAAGGGSALASALGINKSAVSRWKRVPVEHVQKIEKLFGVPRLVQRPDVFGEGE
jgi:DNA-binding transcriptional regulator YdaS (Cro superfamily)